VPLKKYSLSALRTLRSNLPASIPLIGCGGISTGADALEYAKAGASLVQVYTGFGYDGAGACRRIKDQLVESLEKEGATWGEVVKRAIDELSAKPSEKKETPTRVVPDEGSVTQLIEEAEELTKLLDRLEKRMGDGIAEASGSAMLSVA
jgi:dihydroorotate dehydrogenase